MNPLIACPKCRAWLLEGVFNRSELAACPSCGSHLQIEVYPALFRKIAVGQIAQPVMVEGESSCFFHPQKKAIIPCVSCGRFLCALCDCEFNSEHFCPACLEAGRSKGKITSLETQRTRYDVIALSLTLFPLLFIYFTIITAPIALYIGIRHWKSPQSLVGGTRIRMVVAIVLALIEIGGWATLITVIVSSRK